MNIKVSGWLCQKWNCLPVNKEVILAIQVAFMMRRELLENLWEDNGEITDHYVCPQR